MSSILIVDSEKSIRVTTRAFLLDAGYDVLVAKSVDEALPIVADEDIDVVVTDVTLPGRTGVDLLSAIKAIMPEIQVIIMTSEPDVDTASQALREGAFDYLPKPFSKDILTGIVEKAVSLKKLTVEKNLLETKNRAYQESLERLVNERTRDLRESENRLRAILEAAVDPIITINQSGIIESANPAASDLFGYTKEELVGQNVNILTGEPHRERHDEYISNYLKTGEKRIIGFGREEIAIHKNGQSIPVDLTVSEVNLGDRLIFMGILRDLRERRRLQELERDRQRQMIQSDKMASLGVLVSGMAHEINNPNHLIRLAVGQLENTWKSLVPVTKHYYEEHGDYLIGGFPYLEAGGEISKTLNAIRGGSERIAKLVKELKDYARELPEKMNQAVDVNDVVRSANILLQNAIQKATHHFSMQLSEDLPDIQGAFQRLEQVMVSLIMNACQALTDPEQRIEVSTFCDSREGWVIVEIKDEGEGIPPEIMDRLLDPFFTTKSKIGGSGLGLSISSGIVRDHGGELKFSSQPDGGTTVTIKLPMIQSVDNL